MAAVAPGHEEEVLGGLRADRREDRLAAGHGDRRGRQAADRVGVVGGFAAQVGAADIAVVVGAHAVNHGGIGLQPHALAQAVDEHAGDAAALRRYRGLFLHDGGHDQRLVRGVVGQVLIAGRPGLIENPLLALQGAAQQIHIAGAARVEIGFRREPALRVGTGPAQTGHHRGAVQVHQGVLYALQAGQAGAPFAEIPALHQGDAALQHVATVDLFQQREQGVAGVELVLAHMQARIDPGEGAVEPRRPAPQTGFRRLTEQAVGAHSRQQTVERRARRHFHQHRLFQGQRPVQIAAHPEAGQRDADQEQQQQQPEHSYFSAHL